jgi:hypothetical protein
MDYIYNSSYSGGRDQEGCFSKPAWQIVHKTLSRKYPMQKCFDEVTQVAECVSKHEDLSSNPSTVKINK